MPTHRPSQLDLASSDYRVLLKEELAARCRQNPRYSLRAFSRDLKMAPSRLSEILSGKQGLSRSAAERVAAALGYAGGEAERFCDLVESMHARSRVDRETARVRLTRHEVPTAQFQLQLDAFKAISDWYHFGILELLNVTGVKSDSKWIGRKLGISEFEAQLALDRLLRLGLVTWKDGKLKPTHDHGNVPGDVPSDSIKKFHAQLLLKAKDALYLAPLEEREYRSEILAVDRAQLPEAKRAIRDFQHRFCKKMGEAATKDSLYCLAIQFFDLGERG